MGTTKAWVTSTFEELGDRFAVAIGGVPESIAVLRHTKRIDLTLGIEFHPRAVGFKSKNIATGELDTVAVGTLDFRDVVKAMASVDPTIFSIAQGVYHPVGIARSIEGAKDDLAMIALSVPIGVLQVVDVRDGESQDAIFVGENTDGDIQTIGEDLFCFVCSISVAIFEESDGIRRCRITLCREWIKVALTDPKATFGVECQVHRFGDIRFTGY